MSASLLAMLLAAASASGQVAPPEAGPDTSARPPPAQRAHAAEPTPRSVSSIPPTTAARRAEGAAAEANATDHVLMAVVRDFVAGHRDFWPLGPTPGLHAGIVADWLDHDDKPVFASRGFRVLRPGHDASGQPVIGPRQYIAARPQDRAPQVEFVEGASVVSAQTFSLWFRPLSGVNRGWARPVEFRRASFDTNHHDVQWAYVAEIDISSAADGRPGQRTSASTLELPGRFRYRQGAGDRMRFTAAGDLWVFIDGRLVIDLGGAAESADDTGDTSETDDSEARAAQIIDLDRLTWLRNRQPYSIRIFAASRGEGAGQVRIETTVALDGRW